MNILLAMSGGIDSSVAALALLRGNATVRGIFLKMHEKHVAEEERVQEICCVLGIPLCTLDVRDLFSERILQPFLDEYRRGFTPNPCVLCNAEVKFAALFKIAHLEKADRVATGHYATCTVTTEEFGIFRGTDEKKDQSYMLYRLRKEWLPFLLFPLGTKRKHDVARIGQAHFGSLFSGVKESQDICFLPSGSLRHYLEKTLTEMPHGEIVSLDGRTLGRHKGLFRYTIGQREGLGLSGGPWFVVAVDATENKVVVGKRKDLDVSEIQCSRSSWLVSDPERHGPYCAQFRYRCRPVRCTFTLHTDDHFVVKPEDPVEGVAPGQSLVLYQGDRLLGGGIIEKIVRRNCS
jgi:tRNA-specific 2-thiouridylase